MIVDRPDSEFTGRLRDKTELTRAQMAHLGRKALWTVFSDDPVAAAKAAYFVVVSSRSFGEGLDPMMAVNDLSAAQLSIFYRDLQAILAASRIEFVSKMSASVENRETDRDLRLTVDVVISRTLSFEVMGRKVRLGDKDNPVFLDPDGVDIGCPAATRRLSISKTIGDGFDTVLTATAGFVLAGNAVPPSVPIVLVSAAFVESRMIQIVDRVHH